MENMSQLIVEICRVSRIEDHPNADKMKIATVKGWKTAIRFSPETGKAEFEEGDLCIYFPPDTIMPLELANSPDDPEIPGRLGIIQYLKSLPKKYGEAERLNKGGRVAATRLCGIPSYGVIVPIEPEKGDNPKWKEGDNVAEHFGVTKWEPPIKCVDGDAERPHPCFHAYTDIESFGNFPDVLVEGEEVVITEKIHGKNARIGLILDADEKGNASWVVMAGSHAIRRKEVDAHGRLSDYWRVITPEIRALLERVVKEFPGEKKGVILFGEIYGPGVQDMPYGVKELSFRAFDIAMNGEYLDFDVKRELCGRFGIPMVPILYEGPFSVEVLEGVTSGPTVMCESSVAGRFKGREGCVVTPKKERHATTETFCGRAILKSVSADYLGRKNATDNRE